MPREGWTNLTILKKDYDHLRRLFDVNANTRLDWSDWLVLTVANNLERKKKLKELYPNLMFIGNTENGCVIEDTKAKKVITLSWNKGRLTGGDEQALSFAMLNPELRIS